MIQAIGMMEIAAFLKVALYLCGCVGIIAGAVAAVVAAVNTFKKPAKELTERVDDIEDHIKDIDKFLENDKRAIEQLTDKINDLLKIELADLDHQIEGNGIERMKEIRRELQAKM
jgi:archaellum component FlaC